MLTPKDPTSFTDTLADLLRLPDETLAMAYIYLNKYKRFLHTSETTSPLDPYTLSLAALSLAAKSTESPRPPSAILLPAHRLLHSPNTTPPLTTTSPTYPLLRRTLLAAEQHLLRALAFNLRLPSPVPLLPRYLSRALEPFTYSSATAERRSEGTEHDYSRWGKEEKDEWGVVELLETGLGRGVRAWGVRAAKSYELVNFWPSRAVAAGCVWCGLGERRLVMRGLEGGEKGREEEEWVRRVGGGKVDVEDWREVVGILEKL
ncbi:hypothetical protein MMC13_000738 [Lambiella insularis]|nr:hypothetical protein [Lambiella insularis]